MIPYVLVLLPHPKNVPGHGRARVFFCGSSPLNAARGTVDGFFLPNSPEDPHLHPKASCLIPLQAFGGQNPALHTEIFSAQRLHRYDGLKQS